jgi:AhpD family alkylhydroperoxidase
VKVAGSAPPEPRIRAGGRRDVGVVTWAIAQVSGLVTGTTPPNLFLTLGRHRRLFHGWLRYAGRLMPGGSLPRRETELVILRVADRLGCVYEFDHHVQLGRRVGVSAADVERVTGSTGEDGWSPRETAILSAVDALLTSEDLDDEEWQQVSAHLGDRELIELVLLVGHYRMLATAIAALRIQPDGPRG